MKLVELFLCFIFIILFKVFNWILKGIWFLLFVFLLFGFNIILKLIVVLVLGLVLLFIIKLSFFF